MKTITVFTPTYNRAETLKRTYESLCRQTSKDFEWLIIDDGSTDGTKNIVQQWIVDNHIPVRYIYKENGGLHTGYNTAIENIDTELCICCDSDDFMPDDAVDIIVRTWHQKKSDRLAGIIGLDYDMSTGKPIGGLFADVDNTYHFLDIPSKLNHHGDTKMVLRTALLKPFIPMPSYEGEKNFNPIYIYMKVNPELEYLLVNRNLCNVDYQPDGMSANILNQFRNSPRSFAEIRKAKLSHPRVGLKRKFIDAGHLVACALLAKSAKVATSSPQKLLTILALPLGVMMYCYIMIKTSK